jgi:hypothetical protein
MLLKGALRPALHGLTAKMPSRGQLLLGVWLVSTRSFK